MATEATCGGEGSFVNHLAGEYDYIGFRVAAVPEPTTAALLLLGGLAALARRCRTGG